MKRILGVVAALMAAGLTAPVPAHAATVSVVEVEVSADSSSWGGDAVVVPTVVLNERAAGDIGVGRIVLAAPEGFRFEQVPVTVRGVPSSGGLLFSGGSCADGGAPAVSPFASASYLVFEVCAPSTRPVNLQISGLAVRATAGAPLAHGSVVLDPFSTSVVVGVAPGTPFVNLTEVPGATAHLSLAPEYVTTTAGTSVDFTVDAMDRFGNRIADVTLTIAPIPHSGADHEGASCTGTTCRALRAGPYTVDATADGVTAQAVLVVEPAEVVDLRVAPRWGPSVAGETLDVVASGYDRYGNYVPSLPLDELHLEPVAGGGGSAAGASCDASTLSCTATDDGRYRLLARWGSLTAEYWEDVRVVPAAPDHLVADVPARARATLGGELLPFTVTVFDAFGNRIREPHRVDVFVSRNGSGVEGTGSGPYVYPGTGFSDEHGEFDSSYDAGPRPGRDELTVTVTEPGATSPLLRSTFAVEVTLT